MSEVIEYMLYLL